MPTAQQYRMKAAEYAALAETAGSASESREFRALERNCTSLAANREWLASNDSQTVPASPEVDHARGQGGQILRCLGAAVIMRWTTLPKKLRRELFEYAESVGDLQPPELEGEIARFLHEHKDDA